MVLIKDLKPGQNAEVLGKVSRVTDEDEFILRDRSGSISVDANLDDRFLNISKGDRVIVKGKRDKDGFEFDAFRIRRTDGKRILSTDRSFDLGDRFDDDRFDDDVILGTNKRDVLIGTNDEDVLIGKGGKDVMVGGGDSDLFVYETVKHGGDRIKDFSPVADALDLRTVFNQAIYSSPTPFADYLEFQQRGAKVKVRIDPDGNVGDKEFKLLATLNDVVATDLSSSNVLI